MNRLALLALAVLPCSLAFAVSDAPPQHPSLAARETDQGVLFQCYAPHAQRVYLAGPFNRWAENDEGRIRDERYAMDGPDDHGVYHLLVDLPIGLHAYKFCIDGEPEGWFVPSNVRLRDGGGNALVVVDGIVGNHPKVTEPYPPHRDGQDTVFEIQDREAHIIFLAGEFNNWANNRGGLVFDHRFAMAGPDADGIWRARVRLAPGSYRYQFVVNGTNWITNPLTPRMVAGRHSVAEVR